MMKIKIIDIETKEELKTIELDIKKEIDENKDIIKLAKTVLGFTNAKLFDFFLDAIEKSEYITVISYVKKEKFKDILEKIEE